MSDDSRGDNNDTAKRYRISSTEPKREETVPDFTCPICYDQIDEAHVTQCGHTFCYECVRRSVEKYGICASCNTPLTVDQIYPNFAINSIIAKYKQTCVVRSRVDDASYADKLKRMVSCEPNNLTLPDINEILQFLNHRKQILEAESFEAQHWLLNEFLRNLLVKKESEYKRLSDEINVIRCDLQEVEQLLKDVKCTSSKPVQNGDKEEATTSTIASYRDKPDGTSAGVIVPGHVRQRLFSQFDDFVQCYFACKQKDMLVKNEILLCNNEGKKVRENSSLDDFRDCLLKFSRFNKIIPLAKLNYSTDLITNSTIVSSIEFDKDNEYFAIAGVAKRIKVFDYNTVIGAVVDLHYPVVEIVSTSKISCISWNTYHKHVLASSDYEGIVAVWDVSTMQKTKLFQEHEKRCWSVDFNNVDTRMIASGSDDTRVKIWSLNVERSVATLDVKANVCCVKFNPKTAFHLAFGSADHSVHYYDLRKLKEPYCVFKDHRKAVSYVKFLNQNEIVSASTDGNLKIWNINSLTCRRSLSDHRNEKNFIGLATDGDYIACGSENNSMYVYYKGLSKSLFSYQFDATCLFEPKPNNEDPHEFVSAVCWKPQSNVLVAANSQGYIRILELV